MKFRKCGNENCKQMMWLEPSEFYYHPHTRDKLQSWCKQCIKDNTQKQREDKKK